MCGLVSVNWKARSKVEFTESVLFAFVGVINLKEVGEVVSMFILYTEVLVAWLFVVSFAYMEKLCWPSEREERLKRAIPELGVAV